MRIKAKVWHWLAAACGAAGMLYGLGIEGGAQLGGTITDVEFVTAVGLILLALVFMRLGFAAHDAEQARCRKAHRAPENTVRPRSGSRRKAG